LKLNKLDDGTQDFFSVAESQMLNNILNNNFQTYDQHGKSDYKLRKSLSKLSFHLDQVEKFSQQIEKLSFGGISIICDRS